MGVTLRRTSNSPNVLSASVLVTGSPRSLIADGAFSILAAACTGRQEAKILGNALSIKAPA